MSDLIDRQTAIEALENDKAALDKIIKGMSAMDVRLDAYVSQRNQVNYDIYTINNLPPARPEQLSTNLAEVGTDCISREQAIDAIRDMQAFEDDNGQPYLYLCDVMAVFTDEEELPPIQPEIIRCKDCKHFEYDHPYIIQGIPVLGHEVCNAWGDGCKTDENGYCFMAERRTDEQTD